MCFKAACSDFISNFVYGFETMVMLRMYKINGIAVVFPDYFNVLMEK